MRSIEGPAGLASLTVEGIGPFVRELRVPLAPGGTLLLGEGKTTALRAAVLAAVPKHVADQAPGCMTSPLSPGATTGRARVDLASGAWAAVTLCRREDKAESFFVSQSGAGGMDGGREVWGRRVFAYGDARRGAGGSSRSGLPTEEHEWFGVDTLFRASPFARSPEAILREAHRLSFCGDGALRFAWEAVRRAVELAALRGPLRCEDDGRVTLGDVPLRDAGAGVRSLVSWVVDVTARWCAAEADAGRTPTAEDLARMDPILVVDSIDEHLPPPEQLLIFDRVRGVFPRATLLASATSPLTAAGARAGEAVWLRRSATGAWSAEAAPDLRTATAAELLSFADVGDPPHPLGRASARHDALALEPRRSEAQELALQEAAARMRDHGVEPRRRPLGGMRGR